MRGVLGETAIAHLAIAELALYDPEHMLDLRSRAAEPSIAGTLPDCQPVSRRGLFLHRPKHARRLGSALPGTAGVALVAIHRRVVIPDQTVHHPRIVHAAAGHARRVHETAPRIDADMCLHAEVVSRPPEPPPQPLAEPYVT